MRFFYILLYSLALPFLLLQLWVKTRSHPNTKVEWAQRFGFYSSMFQQDCIWIHAVSLGETVAVLPLIKALIKEYPQYRIVLTHSTAAADLYVQEHLKDSVDSVYLPVDVCWAVRRFIRHFKPKIGMIFETELWPNVLAACRKEKLKLFLINGRISEKSFRRYQKFPKFIATMLNTFTELFLQTTVDLQRMRALGLSRDKGVVLGNLKFDLEIPSSVIEAGHTLRKAWGAEQRPVFIAASTHPDEDDIVLDAFSAMQKKIPMALLVLVPRHSTRFEAVAALCVSRGFSTVRRSSGEKPAGNTAILLGDTLGELRLLYVTADIALVGGSLVNIGGHNLLEPAALGLPVLSGPYLQNQIGMRDLLLAGGGLLIVRNAEELAVCGVELLSNVPEAHRIGNAAKTAFLANQGVLQKQLLALQKYLSSHA